MSKSLWGVYEGISEGICVDISVPLIFMTALTSNRIRTVNINPNPHVWYADNYHGPAVYVLGLKVCGILNPA